MSIMVGDEQAEPVRRVSLVEAERVAAAIVAEIPPNVALAVVAGSIRRQCETVGDVDIVCVPTVGEELALIRILASLGMVGGPVKFRGTVDGLHVDVAITCSVSFGAALMHWTGPKSRNIRQRARAMQLGFRLNDKGLFNLGSGQMVSSTLSEKEIYRILGLGWLEPEERT